MDIRPVDRLIITMLCDIHERLKIDDSVDASLIKEAILTDNTWALSWEYSGLIRNEAIPPDVAFVVDVISMWDDIEYSYLSLDENEKNEVRMALKREPKFTGFDGNNESRYLSIADFFINKLGRFSSFKGRKLNSHVPMAGIYQEMLPRHRKQRENMGLLSAELSAAEIKTILQR